MKELKIKLKWDYFLKAHPVYERNIELYLNNIKDVIKCISFKVHTKVYFQKKGKNKNAQFSVILKYIDAPKSDISLSPIPHFSNPTLLHSSSPLTSL